MLMRGYFCGLVITIFSMVLVVTPSWGQGNNKQGVVDARATFLTHYRAGDVQEMMKLFRTDATFAGTLQQGWLTYAQIRELWTNYFSAWPRRDLEFKGPVNFQNNRVIPTVPDVRLFNNNSTAVETGYILMHMGKNPPEAGKPAPPPITTPIRYSITRVYENGKWLIVNMNVGLLPMP